MPRPFPRAVVALLALGVAPPDDGVIDDASGNGLDATCMVGVTCPTQVVGHTGDGAHFDGSTQYARILGRASAFATPAGLTVAAWVSLDVTPDSAMVVAGKAFGATFFNSWTVGMAGGDELGSATTDGASDDYDSVPGVFTTTGVWVHVAIVWDGTNKRLYVNGMERTTIARPMAFDDHDVFIGSDQNSGAPGLFFAGIIDDLVIYARPLDEAELAVLMLR